MLMKAEWFEECLWQFGDELETTVERREVYR